MTLRRRLQKRGRSRRGQRGCRRLPHSILGYRFKVGLTEYFHLHPRCSDIDRYSLALAMPVRYHAGQH